MVDQFNLETPDERFRFRPISLAIVYLVFGIVWIFLSDSILFLLVDDPSKQLQMETAKGIVFVFVSAVLGYLLLSLAYGEYRDVNERLRRSLLEVSILHRLLRHNLRNSVTVILGETDRLGNDDPDDAIDVIERKAEELADVADRATLLHNLAIGDTAPATEIDLPECIAETVQTYRERYPDADVHVDAPDSLSARLSKQVETALAELVENAIVHNDRDRPSVRVSATRIHDNWIALSVEDNGPGIPDIEQRTLQAGYEQMLEHSMGLGLWLVKLITENAGGTIDLGESDLGGSKIELRFPVS